MSRATLTEADLTGAKLIGADLIGADLSKTKYTQVQLEGASNVDKVIL